MRVDPVVRNPDFSIKEILLALDNRLTAIENFAPEGTEGQVLASNGPNTPPSYQDIAGLSGVGLVASVFGRTGNVVAAMGDYQFNQIGNKPTTIAGYGITDAYTRTEVDALLAALVLDDLADVVITTPSASEVLKYDGANWVNEAVDFSELTGTPTTLAGYGITDAYTKTQVDTLLAGKADVATTLAGYGITDAYTKTAVDALLAALTTHDLADWPADAAGVLKNDGAGNYSWVAAGSVAALDDLSDVTISSPASGQALRYNGSLWVNAALTAADIGAGTFPVGTFVIPGTGQLNVTADVTKTVPARLIGYAASSAFAAALGWYDSGGTVYGFVGKGSGGDSDSYMRASVSGSGLQFWATSGAIDFRVNSNFTIRDGAGTAFLAFFKDGTQGTVIKSTYVPTSYSLSFQNSGGSAKLLLDETSARWQFNYPIMWSPDNNYDIGVSTSVGRPRTIYAATSVVVGASPSGFVDVGQEYRTNGTKVLSTRKTGWTAAAGTATRTSFNTGTVTLSQLAERVKALIDDLISHGAIGA